MLSSGITFRNILGHRGVKALLSTSVARATVPPSLLLTGPAGVGKRAIATATAAALNCLSPLSDGQGLAIDACGTCRACDRIARGVHVDVVNLEPDAMGTIKIDVIRDALERTGFRPFEGRRRVVIIATAETMLPPAQNALLKSLEEPTPGTIFILTSAMPWLLLPTVRSRCMPLRLGRLTETEVAEVLTRDHDLSPDAARAAAALADGSVGQALALRETDLGSLRDVAYQLLAHVAKGDTVAARLQAAAPLAADASRKERDRAELALVLRLVASMLRDIELLGAHADHGLLANPGLVEELRRLTRVYAGDRARAAFAAVARAVVALTPPQNAGTKVVADWVAVQL